MTALDKTYDGTTNAAVNYTALAGAVPGDDVSFDSSAVEAHFAVATVGTHISVTLSGLALKGVDAGNYTVTAPSDTADIIAKALTVSGATAADKTYDGDDDATVDFTVAALVGAIGDDDVTLDASAAAGAFAAVDVDNDIAVSVSGLTLSGADAGNYSLTAPGLKADIAARTLDVTAVGVDKVYDGKTTATVQFTTDKLAGDLLSIQHASATFSSASVGTDKAIAVSGLSLMGADAGNYELAAGETSGFADITPAALAITAGKVKKLFGTTLVFSGTEFTPHGLKAADAVTSLTLQSTGAAKNAAFGTYSTIPSDAVGTGLGNYTITYVNGQLTVWGYKISVPAKPLRTADPRKFTRGTTIPVAFVVRTNDGKVVTNVAPKIRVTSYGKTIYGPKTVKYSAAKGKYYQGVKTSLTWGKGQRTVRITLPGAAARSVTIWLR